MKNEKKTLTERLSQEKTEPTSRVSFFLKKDEIIDALESGYTLKKIHQIMVRDGDISIGYSSFTRLANIYIRDKKKVEKKQRHQPTSKRKFVHSSDSSEWTKTVPEEDRKFDSSEYMNYPKGYKKEETPKKK